MIAYCQQQSLQVASAVPQGLVNIVNGFAPLQACRGWKLEGSALFAFFSEFLGRVCEFFVSSNRGWRFADRQGETCWHYINHTSEDYDEK